jgi:hypothetical protein
MDERIYHGIGFRDALAQVCMIARINGPHAAVREAAEALLKSDPEHCHAKAVLAAIDVDERDQRRKAWRKKRKSR